MSDPLRTAERYQELSAEYQRLAEIAMAVEVRRQYRQIAENYLLLAAESKVAVEPMTLEDLAIGEVELAIPSHVPAAEIFPAALCERPSSQRSHSAQAICKS